MDTNFDNPDQLCLSGSLILADPALRDPNFFRSVLLLTEHAADKGAHGFILNRPVGKRVGDLVSALDDEQLMDIPVYMGGPVGQEQLTFAHFQWVPEANQFDFQTHLSIQDASNGLKEGAVVRAFVGYAGWGEGQLESEIQQRSWITCRSDRTVFDSLTPDSMWHELLSNMGPWFQLLANTPENPELN